MKSFCKTLSENDELTKLVLFPTAVALQGFRAPYLYLKDFGVESHLGLWG